MKNKKVKADIVIVGGGISGLYAGWRIRNTHPEKKVIILEKLPKTGGRLDTDVMELRGLDGTRYKVKDEEGGMRFNPSMVELYALFKALDFSFENGRIVPFNMEDPGLRFYLRSFGFTQGDVAESKNAIWSEIYNLREGELNRSPGTLVREVLNSILLASENSKLLARCFKKYKITEVNTFPATPDQWSIFRNEFSFRGRKIHSWGLWPILMEAGLSSEAITMITKAIGFSGPVAQDVNAGEQLQILCDFPNDPVYFTLNSGFEALPDLIGREFLEGGSGNEIHVNTEVTAVSQKDKSVRVEAVNREKGLHLDIECAQLLLTIPKLALTKLMAECADFPRNEQLTESLGKLQNMRLGKINLYYNTRWWHQGEFPICHGGSFTDLPVGAAYVFDPIYPHADSKKYIKANKDEKLRMLKEYNEAYEGPSALTIYCDFDNTTFWSQIQNIGEPFKGSHATPKFATAASKALVDQAQAQLKLIFGCSNIPDPVTTSFRLWGDNVHGFGYHQWKLNVNDAEIRDQIWKVSDRIFLSNEAYSDMQGWANGSLRSTDIMLEKGLGIGPLVNEKDKLTLRTEMLDAGS